VRSYSCISRRMLPETVLRLLPLLTGMITSRCKSSSLSKEVFVSRSRPRRRGRRVS
jgi:hypothetical protein